MEKKKNSILNNKGLTTIAIVLIIVGVIVVAGGTVGGIVGYNAYQEKKQQEEIEAFMKAVEEEQTATINAFNERINAIVNQLLVADANGQNPSLDNNSDVDAMTNAVNELNNVTNDVNSNVVLTQEQKDSLIQSITGQVNNVNTRIQAVNEAKAEAEKQAQEAQASSKKNGGSSNSSSASASGKSNGNNEVSSNEVSSNEASNNSGYTPGYNGEEDRKVKEQMRQIQQEGKVYLDGKYVDVVNFGF